MVIGHCAFPLVSSQRDPYGAEQVYPATDGSKGERFHRALSFELGYWTVVIRHWTLGIRQKNARHFLFLLLFLPSSFSKEKPLSHLPLNRGEFIQPLLLPIFIMRSAPGRQSRDSFSFSVEVFLTIHHQHKSVSSVQSVFYLLLFPLSSFLLL